MPLTTAILLFDDVEVLDFAGPFEVFSVCGRRHKFEPFTVITVAERARPVIARNGLSINPAHSFADCPALDILVVPGGYGTRREMHSPVMLEWVAAQGRTVQFLLSVCTGALILGAAGLLDGLAATTHHLAYGELRAVAGKTDVRENARIVDNGRVILSSGVSAGIDMALHAVSRILSPEMARETARYMEYEGNWTDRSRA
ncbi:MAG: Isonitrile hydratase [Gemmatimonadaceae bacterium]|nr:Isonitrile hydratase [Gemmatimonadaceae bacterium]